MSKILYPVGTQVVLSKYAKRDHRNLTPLFVVEYKKGEKYPYRLSRTQGGSPSEFDGKSKFSVKGLKRYNPTQAKVDQGNAVKQPEPSVTPGATHVPQDTYTRDEVDTLIESAIEYVLAQVDATAFDLHNTMIAGAKITDRNFCKVSKQFKTLNHDDD